MTNVKVEALPCRKTALKLAAFIVGQDVDRLANDATASRADRLRDVHQNFPLAEAVERTVAGARDRRDPHLLQDDEEGSCQ